MKNRKRIQATILCAALTAVMLSGCSEEATEETAEDVAIVEAANPQIGDLKLSGDFIATLSPDESVYVIPMATAEVLEVRVSAGDKVEAGDVLAVLDDTMAQYTVKSAQIGLNTAKTNHDMNFGEGATLLNDMSSDSELSGTEDSINDYQEQYFNAMQSLDDAKNKLKDKEAEYAALKEEYDYNDDVDDIKDYAEDLAEQAKNKANELSEKAEEKMQDMLQNQASQTSFSGMTQEQLIASDPELKKLSEEANDLSQQASDAATRYQNAATEDATIQAEIKGYKQQISAYETTIESYQDAVDKSYEGYSQQVVAQDIQNGELREDSRQLSENNINSAQLQVEQARENLENYTITATISGVIEAVNIDVHDFASSNNPAFVISNKDTMVATYYVSEDVRNTFSIGQKITITKDDKTYEGEVIEIGSAVDSTTGLFRVKASVKGDASNLLSGTRATVTTDTYHENNALIIPYDAVYYDGTQAYVYTVVDDKAQRTDITTGLYDIDNIVVTDGLTKDDLVITTWSAQLREGVAVSVSESE